MTYNIIPINDTEEHIEESICECYPEFVILDNGDMLIIHNAYDNRE